MRKKKRWLYLILFVAVGAFSLFLYTQSRAVPEKPTMPTASNALKFNVERETLSNTIEVKGKSAYVQETTVYAPFSADVAEWSVEDGAQIEKGAPLFKLDDKALRDDIAQQNASLRRTELEGKLREAEQAAASVSRETLALSESEALQKVTQSASRQVQEELDRLNRSTLTSQLETKRAKLAEAQQNAPESGIFLMAGTSLAKRVAEGEAVGKIVDVSRLQMTTYVGEYDVFRIQPGMTAQVTLDALRQTKLVGTVEKVSKFPKPTTNDTGPAQFEVIIALTAHDNLVAGLSLTATIETDNKPDVLTVSTIAVQRDKDSYYVMLDTPEGPVKREVKVGLETAEKTEIVEGLQAGDVVVLQ